MTNEDKKYLREAQEKDRRKQLMFLGGEDQQAKGILLASVTAEILHTFDVVSTGYDPHHH